MVGTPHGKGRRLDQIDLKILTELQRQGRITNQRLSELIGLSARPCLERVRQLEAAGYIAHYRAILDIEALPDLVAAFAEITLKSQATQALAAFERRIADCAEVVECYLVGGQFDYLAQIVCPSIDRYNELTTAWIDDPDLPVGRIVSNFIIKPIRQFSGYALVREDSPRSPARRRRPPPSPPPPL
ncbi:MAG TPA: Lrp/AsnC family transcriptional regulator [Aliidongia sp.]|nr:Lrp/AsnC family transcriptional regulator [Aliidongia sp.]